MPVGLTKDAGWQIGVSRTVPFPPEAVWTFLTGDEGLALWLGPGATLSPEPGTSYGTAAGVVGEVRGYRVNERVRVTHGDTVVQFTLSPAANSKTTLRFHQERMSSAAQREQQREHWQRVMADVVAALDG
ncbi:SRPBCC family protein [Actinokineospora pegani]|uniref:SRPBCC family protein n=1 Tax=Actinokineospora pegani TaxID=2654637 RepID=UPI0012EA226F|nr:SRPBCC domain-containing protein [Actinokineospora pegani]